MPLWSIIYDKGKNTWWEKIVSSISGARKNWAATCKIIKLEDFLTPYTKINSKWIKDLNIRLESIKLPEENVGKTFSDTNHRNFFLDQSPKAKETKEKINKWDLAKFKSFCTAKETTDKTKKQHTEWKKIFANDMTNKGLISKIYKAFMQLNIKKITQLKMGRRTE